MKSEQLKLIRCKFYFCIGYQPGALQVKSSHSAILRDSFHWQFPRGQEQISLVAENHEMIIVTRKISPSRSLCLNPSAQRRVHNRFPLPVTRQFVETAASFARKIVTPRWSHSRFTNAEERADHKSRIGRESLSRWILQRVFCMQLACDPAARIRLCRRGGTWRRCIWKAPYSRPGRVRGNLHVLWKLGWAKYSKLLGSGWGDMGPLSQSEASIVHVSQSQTRKSPPPSLCPP